MSDQAPDKTTIHEEAAAGAESDELTARAAETGQRIFRDVIAAAHRDFFDRIGHIQNGDGQESFGEVLRCAAFPRCVKNLSGECREFLRDGLAVKRFIGIRSENMREEFGAQLAKHDIAIGHR